METIIKIVAFHVVIIIFTILSIIFDIKTTESNIEVKEAKVNTGLLIVRIFFSLFFAAFFINQNQDYCNIIYEYIIYAVYFLIAFSIGFDLGQNYYKNLPAFYIRKDTTIDKLFINREFIYFAIKILALVGVGYLYFILQ